MNNNPYSQYQNSKILTASPAELTLMLYEGAIKFGNIAIAAMKQEKKDIEKAHTNIVKVQRIIEEFRATLNWDYPVAQDFENVYVYLLQRLLQANMSKDPEIMEEVVGHLRTMRDTWIEVMNKNKRGEV
ncbi:MAG: flagellar export chaperone FliS [Lachnospiraceae bacterium]|nr:flagellar export chaperone FliS [Lachnospiraceae bacterium]